MIPANPLPPPHPEGLMTPEEQYAADAAEGTVTLFLNRTFYPIYRREARAIIGSLQRQMSEPKNDTEIDIHTVLGICNDPEGSPGWIEPTLAVVVVRLLNQLIAALAEVERLRHIAMWADVMWGLGGDEEDSGAYLWGLAALIDALERAGYTGSTTFENALAATQEASNVERTWTPKIPSLARPPHDVDEAPPHGSRRGIVMKQTAINTWYRRAGRLHVSAWNGRLAIHSNESPRWYVRLWPVAVLWWPHEQGWMKLEINWRGQR